MCFRLVDVKHFHGLSLVQLFLLSTTNLPRNPVKRLRRTLRAGNRPPDHQMGGTPAHHFGGRRRPLLVAGIRAGRPHTGYDQQRLAAEFRSQHGQFQSAGHKSPHAGGMTHLGQTHHLLAHAAVHTASLERGLVGAGQNRHAENRRGLTGLGDGGGAHFRSAGKMDRAQIDPPSAGGPDRRCHGVRDIVKFQIEENFGPAALDGLDRRRPGGSEQLEPDFVKSGPPIQLPDQLSGLAQRRLVERHDDFRFAGPDGWMDHAARMQVRARAKINLNLRVLGRDDATGYHDIETWMVPVGLSDELRVVLDDGPGIRLSCSDPQLDAGTGNLAWRAAELFLRETGISSGVSLELHKHIPHGAGLGGGSSDAAAVFHALNGQTGCPLDENKLALLAARLGSDVPFFIRAQAALARGRGEKLQAQPLSRPLDLLLIKPPFGVETAWAYSAWDAGRRCPAIWTAPQLFDGMEIFNDLESPVFDKFLVLADLKLWLLEHSLVAAAGLSGSGSCLFAILRDARGAEDLAAAVHREFGATFWTAAVRTL